MPDFYFFTDTDLLQTQTASEAYGPATTSGGNDRFRTTSLHTATGAPYAYATCNGQVFVQETINPISGGPDLVNLILRPFFQTSFDIGYVKYYIYKGILKSSLIDANGTQIAPAPTNDLTNIIWEAQDKINASVDKRNENPVGTTTTPAPVEALGVQFTATASAPENIKLDTDFVEDLFFRENAENQVPAVKAGWNLGEFQAAAFGFEIVVERMGIEPTFGLIRKFEHLVEVVTLPTSPTPTLADEMIHFNQKERILSFIDPAAFYGSFYGYELKSKNSVGATTTLTSDDIYDQCLIDFFNKNLVYLDIRNHLNYSIDYFRNYGRDIKLSTDNQSSPSTIDYYASGWPILTLNTFVANSNNPPEQNTIRLKLPKGTNDMPALYFINARTEAVFPKNLERIDRFGTFYLDETAGFLDLEIILAPPRHGTGVAISSHVKLQYFNRIDVNSLRSSNNTTLEVDNYYDHLFRPFQFHIPWEITNGVKSKVNHESLFVDIFSSRGVEFMASVGVAQDNSGNTTFFAFSEDKIVAHSSIQYISPGLISQKYPNLSMTRFIEEIAKKLDKTVEYYSIEDSGETYFIKHIQDKKETELDSNTSTAKDILFMEFTADEMQQLDALKMTNTLLEEFPISLNFKSETSVEPQFAQKYQVYLEGFQLLPTSPFIQIISIATGIYKYKIVESIDFSTHPIMSISSFESTDAPIA